MGGGGPGRVWGGQGGCERRIEVFWENSQKKIGGGGGGRGGRGGVGGGGGGVRVGGGQGGCERRIKAFVKIQKKTPTKLQSQNIFKESTGGGGGSGWGVRMDVNEELKFL